MRTLTVRTAQILLAAVVAVRASSFLFSKLLLQTMGPFTLMGTRFLLAFVLLAAIFWKKTFKVNRRTFLFGMALGFGFFLVMAFELHAIEMTDTSTASFLENTAIVIVPLGEALLARRLPSGKVVASALVAMAGVGLLTLSGTGLALGPGEAMCLVAAFFYAAVMMLTARFACKEDALSMGIWQVFWIGAFGLAAALLTETPLAMPTTPAQWAYLAVLVVVCSGFGFTLQPMVQRPLTAERVSLFCAISPMVATILGVAVLGERLSPQGVVGLLLILLAILVATVPGAMFQPRRRGDR